MTIENVIRRFQALMGSDYDAGSYSLLIGDSAAQIARKAGDNTDSASCAFLLESAAAALAFYRARLLEAAKSEVGSFKAGDVTITHDRGRTEAARALYEEAIEACGGLIDTDDFVFGRDVTICTEI